MAGYGLGRYAVEPPSGQGLTITDRFHIVAKKSGDPDINSRIDTTYPNVAIITFDALNQFGGMWAKEQLDLTLPFSTEMYLYLGHEAGKTGTIGDGMTFTMHNDPAGLDAIGGAGEGLGVYKGRKWTGAFTNNGDPITVDHGTYLRNSLVVEFDTYENTDGPNVFDLKNGGAHCAIFAPWRDIFYFSEHENRFGITVKPEWVKFQASWTPNDSGGGTLNYSFDNTSRSYKVTNIQSTFGGTKVYWGFTGATGQHTAVQAAAITKLPVQGVITEKRVQNQAGKDINNSFAMAGETIRYVINIRTEALINQIGPITLEDELAAELEYVSSTQVDVTSNFAAPLKVDPEINGNTIKVDTGLNLTDQSDWIEIAFDVKVKDDTAAGTMINNYAVIPATGGMPEEHQTNNTVINILESTQPVKEVSGSSKAGRNSSAVRTGESISYEIAYANSTGAEVDISITDVLPVGLDYVFASDGGQYDPDTRTVTWTLLAVPANTIGNVTLEVQVNAAALVKIENTATVTIGSTPKDTNTVTNPVVTEGSSKKVADTSSSGQNGGQVRAGDEITYEIAYKNDTETASTITITDRLPVGVDFASASDDGIYDGSDRTVTWTINNVASGTQSTVSLSVSVNDKAMIRIANYATIQVGSNAPQYTNLVVNPLRGLHCSNIRQKTQCRQIIRGQLLWNDDANLNNTRPPSVEIVLIRDGEEYKSISMDSLNDTNFAFPCIPMRKNHTHQYSYQVDELGLPDNYTEIVAGSNIVNNLASQGTPTEIPSGAKKVITSTLGTLDAGAKKVTEVPADTKVETFKAGLSVSPKATVEILDASGGSAVADPENTNVTAAMVIEVTAEDGTTQEYAIEMATPPSAD